MTRPKPKPIDPMARIAAWADEVPAVKAELEARRKTLVADISKLQQELRSVDRNLSRIRGLCEPMPKAKIDPDVELDYLSHGLSIRAMNILERLNVTTAKQLSRHTELKIATMKGAGKRGLDELRDVLSRAGLTFETDDNAALILPTPKEIEL